MPGMDRYLEELHAAGVLTDPALAAAFRAVPREIFLASGFHRPDGRVLPGDPGFLETVYRDTVLVTKVHDGVPVSSSSQPSLMAEMLTALHVAPGHRILEIGAGTGYNAALLAALGADVTTVEVQEDVAAAAASALDRAGVTGARVLRADGWDGAPDLAPFDRIIVTVGITGVSAAWPDQLAPSGMIVAPIAHGGLHPVMTVHGTPSGPRARPVSAAGFMTAAGPLSAPHAGSHPPPVRVPLPSPAAGPSLPALNARDYHSLWFAAAVWDRRVTSVPALHADQLGGFGLYEPGPPPSLAALLPDGHLRTLGPAGDRLRHDLAALADRWLTAGSPPLTSWTATLTLAGDPTRPIRVPAAFAPATYE
ncbi:protein-L-isoaspartate O-methyltransferase family protein [Catenuloplanes atrovinosus]|uniref:Protein-L-isoaspartate O-methyltransferase n=1 Tax=Catenuloplanes atrovinosus TaxID=137266 RepID=A0AAE3YIA6_9ACTN|nr:methyltransferase domain-containing protein [Catenuloplanes atrovinosus]MDR7273980.1 protein-L-isoaspartate(D-aspartate) O-methyltransferase [Catenuloplanes atrovinosus]